MFRLRRVANYEQPSMLANGARVWVTPLGPVTRFTASADGSAAVDIHSVFTSHCPNPATCNIQRTELGDILLSATGVKKKHDNTSFAKTRAYKLGRHLNQALKKLRLGKSGDCRQPKTTFTQL
ncbi:hypothetical protein CBL_09467 [Carabus blaptoides fortunei]